MKKSKSPAKPAGPALPQQTKKWLTLVEAGLYLGCSEGMIRKLIRAGQLAAADIAVEGDRRQWRIAVTELDRFMAERTIKVG